MIELLEFIPRSQHAAIAAGTSVYDCSAALAEALDAFPNQTTSRVNPSGFYEAVPEIRLPSGSLYFASTIQLKKTVRLTGAGGGHPTGYATMLQFARDITGIIVHSHNTIGTTTQAPATTSGGGSIIEGIALFGTFGGTVGHGIHVRAACEVRNCNIVGFAEDGYHNFASAGSGNDTEGNANTWRASNLRIQQCGGHGFFVKGADANAGTAIGIDASANAKCGIYDSSFLGNTYIGCHSASNADSAYRADNANARCVFMGCYSEGGSAPSMILAPSIVVGGLHGAGFAPTSTAMVIGVNGDDISNASFPGNATSSREFVTKMGRHITPDVAMQVQATGDHPFGVQLARWHEPNKTWGLWWASAVPAYWMTTQLSTEKAGRASSIGPGKLMFPNGVWIGSRNGTEYRHQTVMSSVPASGEWARGDIVYNANPSAGGFLGWTCTAGGTPGTWKAFGAIEA